MLFVMKFCRVKNEEFRFGTEIDGVGETSKLQIALSALRYRTRIKGITFFSYRVDGVAYQTKSCLF